MDGLTTVATYAYDGQNRRTTKTSGGTTRHYYYTASWQIVEERTGTSTSADRQFVWGLRYLDDLVLRDKGSERLYVFHDYFNATAVADAQGSVQERYGYDAFGQSRVMTPAFASRSSSNYDWETRYAAYRWDSESGLYQVRNRLLHPKLGRWLTRDPINYHGGVNLYRYAANNPANSIDLSGLKSKSCPFKVVGKTYIDTVGNNIGTVAPGGSQAALDALAFTIDLVFNENPGTDAMDQRYRLYSEKTYIVACNDDNTITYKSLPLNTGVGGEGPFEPGPLRVVFNKESATESSVMFSWKVRGRPDPSAEIAFSVVMLRNCWYIHHTIEGMIYCQDKQPFINVGISGSNFPSHRGYINNLPTLTSQQGALIGLWNCSTTPLEIV
jgi:RHS repeat-associated protein